MFKVLSFLKPSVNSTNCCFLLYALATISISFLANTYCSILYCEYSVPLSILYTSSKEIGSSVSQYSGIIPVRAFILKLKNSLLGLKFLSSLYLIALSTMFSKTRVSSTTLYETNCF